MVSCDNHVYLVYFSLMCNILLSSDSHMLGNQSELLPSAGHAAGPESLRSHAKDTTLLQLTAARRCKLPLVLAMFQVCQEWVTSDISTLLWAQSQFRKLACSNQKIDLLRDLKRQGCCKESSAAFLLVGGAITKTQLRRFGWQKNAPDPIEHRNVLSVHQVNKWPGLSTVLQALKRHRELYSKSLKAPTQAFK